MKSRCMTITLSALLLAACGQAGPLALPDKAKTAATPAPATTPMQVVPALPGLDQPATPGSAAPATSQEPKKDQP